MKVLHLIGGGDVGGAKTAVLSLVKELGRHIDVKIISFRYGIFAEEAQAMGIHIEVIKTGNLISDVKRVLAIIREENYDILHSHGAKANMIAAIVKHITDCPTVTTVHSDYRLDYLQSVPKMLSYGIINTLALRHLDYQIGVSENYKKMLVERKFSPQNLFTVYNGIDFSIPAQNYSRKAFSEKYNVDLRDDDIVVGILARFDPVKGLPILLQAAREVLNAHPSAKFIIGGEGKDRKALERKAAELGITGQVYFPGWISDSNEFMSIIDINVLTSLSESFPYVILEGTKFRKATVSSRVGGVSDLIENDVNGFLFNVGDFRMLARHLSTLIENPALRLEMGEKIYTKASTYFSLDNMRKTQLEIYEKILQVQGNTSAGRPQGGKGPYDAVISGWYGVRNIGDDAILRAIINDLRSLNNDIRILVLSKKPLETRHMYGVDSIYRYNLFRIAKAMKGAGLFINGGGTLIQDMTSTRSLIYYLAVIWLAGRLGLKTMIYANGIGPVKRFYNRKLTQWILNRVEMITLREKASLEELKGLGIHRPEVHITADPALTIASISDQEIDRILEAEGIGEGPYVGFSVRSWDGQKKYVETLARLADHVIEKYHAKPVFIPMQYPNDYDVMKSILSKMKGQGYIIKEKYGQANESCILGLIGRMEIMVGMRLHSLIFAVSKAVPLIGLPYEQKVDGFLDYIQMYKQASAGNVRELNYERLKKMLDQTWSDRKTLQTHLGKIAELHKAKAFENARIAIGLIRKEMDRINKEI
jgi:L-malate glycosyltransferase